jgi:hypothetical protein
MTGKWSGTYSSTTDASTGTFAILFRQDGTQLTGSISIQPPGCVNEGAITGTLNGTTIAFGAVKGAQTIDYTGSVSGNTMSGTYSAPGCDHAKGTWTATKG